MAGVIRFFISREKRKLAEQGGMLHLFCWADFVEIF